MTAVRLLPSLYAMIYLFWRVECHAFPYYIQLLFYDFGNSKTQDHVLRRYRTGAPFAGFKMLCEASISNCASNTAACPRGTCTAIWSPSKSALNAVQTNGCNLNRLYLQSTLVGMPGYPNGEVLGPGYRYWVSFQYVFKNIPNYWFFFITIFFADFTVFTMPLSIAFDNERLEQLSCHVLWKTTLVQFQVWTNHDYRTRRIINTLTQ